MSGETLIKIFFNMLLNIKLYHWQTKGFARHKASDELHESLSNHIDKFIEVYIGLTTNQNRPKFANGFSVEVKSFTDVTIIEKINEYIKFLKVDIPTLINKDDTDLLNICDEMLADLRQALYLFSLK